MNAKEWEDKYPWRYVDEELLNEMAEVAAYFEMNGQIRAKYEDVDASEYFSEYLIWSSELGLDVIRIR